MNRKYMSMLILVAIIFISLALSGYSFLVSNHAAAIPMIYSEGMDNNMAATQPSTIPVAPDATATNNGLASNSFAPPVSATTSGQKNATKQAVNQNTNKAQADTVQSSSSSSFTGTAY